MKRITQGLVSIVDQGMFSASNFILNIVAARTLTPGDYGVFALLFSAIMVLGQAHNALLLEPMTVLGPSDFRHSLPGYIGTVRRLNYALTSVAGTLFALVAWAAFHQASNFSVWTIITAGVAPPAILSFWFVRRSHYVVEQPTRAAALSLTYAFGIAVSLLVVLPKSPDPKGALICLSLSSLGALAAGRKLSPTQGEQPSVPPKQIARAHWRYGRWTLGASMLTAIATQVQLVVIAAVASTHEAGAFRAMQMLVLPVIHTLGALSILIMPILSRELASGATGTAFRRGRVSTALFALFSIAYGALLIAMPSQLESLLFGGKYQESVSAMRIFAGQGIFFALALGPSIMLRADQKPQHQFVVGVILVPVAVTSALVFTKLWGLEGAAASTVLTYGVSWLATYTMYRRWANNAI